MHRINGDVRKWLHELCWDSCLGPPGSFQGINSSPASASAAGTDTAEAAPAPDVSMGLAAAGAAVAVDLPEPQEDNSSIAAEQHRQVQGSNQGEGATGEGGAQPEGGPLVDTFRMFFPQRYGKRGANMQDAGCCSLSAAVAPAQPHDVVTGILTESKQRQTSCGTSTARSRCCILCS
jgi:hypothetical protein